MTPKVNTSVNGRLWEQICQWSFTNDNKCTRLLGDGDSGGEAVHVSGLGIYGKSLSLPTILL